MPCILSIMPQVMLLVCQGHIRDLTTEPKRITSRVKQIDTVIQILVMMPSVSRCIRCYHRVAHLLLFHKEEGTECQGSR